MWSTVRVCRPNSETSEKQGLWREILTLPLPAYVFMGFVVVFIISLHSKSMHLLSRSIILLEFKKFFIKPTLCLSKSIFFINSENKIESLQADNKTHVHRVIYLLFMLRDSMSIIVLMNCPGTVYTVDFLSCSIHTFHWMLLIRALGYSIISESKSRGMSDIK